MTKEDIFTIGSSKHFEIALAGHPYSHATDSQICIEIGERRWVYLCQVFRGFPLRLRQQSLK